MSSILQKDFNTRLLNWWQNNRRKFPWRDTKDPYKLLVAEVLLHRTKAKQVVQVYIKFVKIYSDMKSLGETSEEEIERLLYPLGLKWRVRLLLQMAKCIRERFDGKIPVEKKDLESLPGVSHYTASAIRSFGFGLPDPILDTNTVRIVGRVYGLPVNDSSRRSKLFREKYDSLMDKAKPREFNFAMIDLAALICRPVNPACSICPVQTVCVYGMSGGNQK